MLRVPFEMTSLGITLDIQTAQGEKKFLVDTGATITAIRSSQRYLEESQQDFRELKYLTTSQFIIGGKDFGPMALYLLDITPEMKEIDGILGMTFLNDHIVYIDFRKKMLYLSDRVERSK